MSYNTNLQSNNTDLRTILDTINTLPEAGSGSGGSGTVETCTIKNLNSDMVVIVYMDSTLIIRTVELAYKQSVDGVPKNSMVLYRNKNGAYIAPTISVGEYEVIERVTDYYGSWEGWLINIQSDITIGTST